MIDLKLLASALNAHGVKCEYCELSLDGCERIKFTGCFFALYNGDDDSLNAESCTLIREGVVRSGLQVRHTHDESGHSCVAIANPGGSLKSGLRTETHVKPTYTEALCACTLEACREPQSKEEKTLIETLKWCAEYLYDSLWERPTAPGGYPPCECPWCGKLCDSRDDHDDHCELNQMCYEVNRHLGILIANSKNSQL
jgi:hypothetical protein